MIVEKFTWTAEQEAIFRAVSAKNTDGTPQHTLIKINAVAGASKTTTLVELAKRASAEDPSRTFRYLVFGNANATEAKFKFGHNAICSTLHSLAYQAVVKPYKLKTPIMPFITWKDIPNSIKIPFGLTEKVIQCVSDFCNSGHTDLFKFLVTCDIPRSCLKPVQQILAGMADGKIVCTHAFYLKLYHIGLLDGSIVPATEDILAVDEAGDLTQITLDIFNTFPAHQKIMVGDSAQAIFQFMGCVNGFTFFKNRGIALSLTKSFRVSEAIADRIQQFCQKTFNPSLIIHGMKYVNPLPKTHAYITRTNSSLVRKIVELNKTKTPFQLVSKMKASQLFKYPLYLIGLKQGSKIVDPVLKQIQKDVDKWYTDEALQLLYSSASAYILAENSGNPDLKAANVLINIFDKKDIIEAFKATEAHKNTSHGITLTTAHSSKGLEYDEVTFDNDMDTSISDIMMSLSMFKSYQLLEEEIAELKLYYVAASRCRYKLNNAAYI